MKGLEVLRNLFHLNLSNNLIVQIDPCLGSCKRLHVLDLSMNRITTVNSMPQLTSLVILHLNDNKVNLSRA